MANNETKQEGGKMTTAALQLDTDLLNELFDNQKKLDDLFSFDDESILGSSMLIADDTSVTGSQDIVDLQANNELSYNYQDNSFEHKKRSMFAFVAPIIIEIAVIVFAIWYFI